MIRERERETQLMISRDVRASAMEILAMFGWDLVLHAQGLEFSPFEAMEIHCD